MPFGTHVPLSIRQSSHPSINSSHQQLYHNIALKEKKKKKKTDKKSLYARFLASVFVVISFLPKRLLSKLAHAVQSRTGAEPLELALVTSVVEQEVDRGAVLLVDNGGQGLADSELRDLERDAILGGDLVVVSRGLERQREHTLLLEVGLCEIGYNRKKKSSKKQFIRSTL